MSRSGFIGIGLAAAFLTALGVVSFSCVDTSGLAGGAPPGTDGSTVDTDSSNPDPCGKDLQTDLGNCGSCGNVCGFGANSFPVCTAGKCSIGCNTQFGNCDGNDANGCETSLAGDPQNCNACGRDCSGGACSNGLCGAVSVRPKDDAGTDDGYPLAIALDDTSIFYTWYSSTNGIYDIVKLDKASGEAVILTSGTNYYSQYLTVDNDPNGFVYFVRPLTTYFGAASPSTPPSSADGAILKVAKTSPDGGLQTPIVVVGSSGVGVAGGQFVDGNYTRIFLTSDSLYYSEYGVNDFGIAGGGVLKCPLSAPPCTPTQLVPNGFETYSYALDSNGFAYNNLQTDTVFTCPITGCPASPTQLQTALSAHMMAIDAANYYWINNSNNSIVKADRTSNTTTQLATGQPSPYSIAVDEKNVYWLSSNNPGTLAACAITGCVAPTPLVTNITAGRALAVDSTAIYWASQTTGGSVYKVVK